MNVLPGVPRLASTRFDLRWGAGVSFSHRNLGLNGPKRNRNMLGRRVRRVPVFDKPDYSVSFNVLDHSGWKRPLAFAILAQLIIGTIFFLFTVSNPHRRLNIDLVMVLYILLHLKDIFRRICLCALPDTAW